MEIKLYTDICKEISEIEIHIKAPELNEEVINLEKSLKQITTNSEEFIGFKDNDIFIIKLKDIIKFFNKDKYVYCQTTNDTFKIKETLSALEEKLSPKDFIRISNSTIVNINYVKCFNTSIIGKLIIKFNDNTEENVSRRKIPEIMKFLKERRN